MILAYNTSLADLHIGLFSDNAVPLAEFHQSPSENDRGIHDALLAQKTSDLLQELSASAKDISIITFINGPGSFTGLRIGLAFAKGMAFGLSPVGQTLSPPVISLIPLLAHEVLARDSRITINEERTTNHESRSAILYPGYEKSSVYISFPNEPRAITYLPISELLKMNITEVICTPELSHIPIPHHIVSIELQTMAQMASTINHLQSTIDISSLEPFYGTDFKTGK